ncbi:MAG TPA: hypothetical protein PKA90_13730 [Ignavibacteria bacterium]|nr:hypothetical protein [Ignavibacteria bacterium]HMR41479.1 hypothetical protein [Ignavibacteria bacterium]
MNKTRTPKEVKKSILKGLDEAVLISKMINKQKRISQKNEAEVNTPKSKKNIYVRSEKKEMVMDKRSN